MNRLLIATTLILLASSASAQTEPPRKLGSSTGQHVFVIDANSREWQGKLITVSKEALEIEGESGLRRFNLADIKRVDADGDGVLDGFLKGATFGALMGLLFAPGDFKGTAMISGSIAYGLIGLGADAINRCKQTVYRGAATPAPQVAMKFSW